MSYHSHCVHLKHTKKVFLTLEHIIGKNHFNPVYIIHRCCDTGLVFYLHKHLYVCDKLMPVYAHMVYACVFVVIYKALLV